MSRTLAFLFVAALAGAGCVSTEEARGPVSAQAPAPLEVRAAAIQALAMQPGTLKNVQGMEDAPALFARELRDALALRQPGWRLAIAPAGVASADADLTAVTQLLEVDGGSAAMRFWIGLGTGAIVSRVKVQLLDRAGKVVAATEISQRTTCPMGACGEENEPMVRQNLKTLAASAAEFVANPAEYERRRAAGR